MFVRTEYVSSLSEMGLTSIEAIFNLEDAHELKKENIASHRSRCTFELPEPIGTTVFLKRYDHPPKSTQLKKWITHRHRAASADFDHLHTSLLAHADILTPKVIAYGAQWQGAFEKRSFVITEKIPNADALERRLPPCFEDRRPTANVKEKIQFIAHLADFARRFHLTGLCHRDFYLAHIFLDDDGQLHLIDLHRTFKPGILAKRHIVKDIAQLHYSTPGDIISRADRLRFYLRYARIKKITPRHRRFLRRVNAKAWRMADHDIKHGQDVPFAK